ncbi:hypothetical protein [Thalassobaculum sp.]|uniref:hypothetical protein n=1 Tax=Thalassobaculum sp. TaxID=2022740 RepID=UPI0032EB2FAE
MSFRSIEPSEIPALHPVAHVRDGWANFAGTTGIAPWSSFDPVDYPYVLPWVMLLRQEDPADPERLRYVICGDGCRKTFGMSYQGKLFGEDLPGSVVAQRRAEFQKIRNGHGPLYSRTPLPIANREFIDIYRGVFGFSSDDASGAAAVDRYLVVVAPLNVQVPARQPAGRGIPQPLPTAVRSRVS